MAANITSWLGRNADLAVNLCYKQPLLKRAPRGIKLKSSFLKIVPSAGGNSIRKFRLIYNSSSPLTDGSAKVMKNGGRYASVSCETLIYCYQKQ